MKVSDAFPSKFLSAKDLGGRSFKLQIARIVLEEIQDSNGTKSKPIIYFVGAQKGMVLNKTNADAISIVLGDETDQWLGHTLELFSMRVQGPQGMTDGLRCRVILPQVATPASRQPARELPPPVIVPGAHPAQVSNDLDDSIPF